MAKTVTNFRLSGEAIAALDKIAAHTGLSRTAVIEVVMREVARRDLRNALDIQAMADTAVDAVKSAKADAKNVSGDGQAIQQTGEKGSQRSL